MTPAEVGVIEIAAAGGQAEAGEEKCWTMSTPARSGAPGDFTTVPVIALIAAAVMPSIVKTEGTAGSDNHVGSERSATGHDGQFGSQVQHQAR